MAMPRKNRLLQLLLYLMLVTVILPILFNLFISHTYQSETNLENLDGSYQAQDRITEELSNLINSVNNESTLTGVGTDSNLTKLRLSQKVFLRTIAGSSLEDQIAFGFSDITDRLHHIEMVANDRRHEINQLMKEIRQLWSLIQARKTSQSNDGLPTNQVTFPPALDADKVTNKSMQNTSNQSDIFLKANQPQLSMVASDYVHVPSLLSLMSYLHLKINSTLDPIFRLGTPNPRLARFVFGIPTVKRTVESYLMQTLQNLLQNLSPVEKQQALFIVFVAETDIEFVRKTANEIYNRFPNEVKLGLIEVISPPDSYYPNMSTLKRTLGDPMDRVKWRSKQNLDFAYLMMYCQSRGIYYIQLEDDIITKPSYLTKMQTFITKNNLKHKDWILLDFCSLGFIGKLFKSTDLSKLVLFFVMFYNDKPVDWLLENFVDTKMCHFDQDRKACLKQKETVWLAYKPSLFQHIGTHSSLKGKVQKLKDKGFGKVKLYESHDDNPPALLYTTMKHYQRYSLNRAYKGDNFFWGLSPVKNDIISFKLNTPTSLERCVIRSGNPEHPADILQNATLQVKPSRYASINDLVEKKAKTSKYTQNKDGFVVFDTVIDGYIDILLPKELNPLEELRIHFHDDCNHWIILNEIYLKQLDQTTVNTTT